MEGQPPQRLESAYAVLDRFLSIVLIALVAGMVLCVTGEILLNGAIQPILSSAVASLSRKGISSGALPSLLEWGLDVVAASSAPINTASQTLLVWVGILGSTLALRRRAHLGVDALVRYYPYKVRVVLDYISTTLVGLFSLFVLVIGGYLVCSRAFEMGSKMPGIQALNRGWFYIVLVLAGALNLAYCLHHLIYPRPVETTAPLEDAEGETT